MSKILFITVFIVLTIVSCSSIKKQPLSTQTQQGIDGYVYKISGNQMPGPGITQPKPQGIATIVYIYKSTNLKDVARVGNSPSYRSINKKLITTVQSDSTGHFFVALPVGSYSLFIKVNDLFYANSFDVANNIALYKVTERNITNVVINQSISAVF